MSNECASNLHEYTRSRHSVTKLVAHLVFTTKYRRKLFTATILEQLHDAFASSCNKMGCELIEFNGEEDHVHLLIKYPPKVAVSVMVNNLKSVSSRMVRQLNTHLMRQSKNGALWSRSYFASSTGGANIETLREYVQSQKAPED